MVLFSLLFFKIILKGVGVRVFFFPSLFVTLLLFEIFLLFFVYSWRGKGGMSFFFFFRFEKGRATWVYLFTIFLVFIIIYILLSHFLPPEGGGEGGMGFIILCFFCIVCKFLLLVFCLTCEEGVGLFFLFYFIFNKKFGIFLLFEGWKGAQAF